MDLEAFNDNGRMFISVACSICGGETEPHAPGVEPVCLKCFYGDEPLPCALCGRRAESICGRCGDRICGDRTCLTVHDHNPSPRGALSRPAPGP